jgi:hypothetical protein
MLPMTICYWPVISESKRRQTLDDWTSHSAMCNGKAGEASIEEKLPR